MIVKYFELTPAYGRDYKTKAAVIADWKGDKDFRGDYSLGFMVVNRTDLLNQFKSFTVNLRYKGNRNVTVVREVA